MTKQEVLAVIVECTERLGHVPSRNELRKHAKLSRQHIRRHFGTYTQALRECNLEKRGVGRRLGMALLFADWAGIVRALKKLPTVHEYEDMSKYSQRPLLARFRTWAQTPVGLKLYAEENGLAEEWKDVLEIVEEQNRLKKRGPLTSTSTVKANSAPRILTDRPMLGPLMRPYPLLCGPTNESGVVYLFGAVAASLGFVMLRIQTEFPDGEGLRLVAPDRWQRVRIEFEYESRNFLRHLHQVSECDVIVCWEHNWPDCPLEVVELKSALGWQPFAWNSEAVSGALTPHSISTGGVRG